MQIHTVFCLCLIGPSTCLIYHPYHRSILFLHQMDDQVHGPNSAYWLCKHHHCLSGPSLLETIDPKQSMKYTHIPSEHIFVLTLGFSILHQLGIRNSNKVIDFIWQKKNQYNSGRWHGSLVICLCSLHVSSGPLSRVLSSTISSVLWIPSWFTCS